MEFRTNGRILYTQSSNRARPGVGYTVTAGLVCGVVREGVATGCGIHRKGGAESPHSIWAWAVLAGCGAALFLWGLTLTVGVVEFIL
jgi:hypothetical protein